MFEVRQAEAKTLSWWNLRRDRIEMDPPYQRRGGLWSVRDQGFLIDSILNGYDVPKVYLADFSYQDSPLNITRKQYAMIDGKQRFEAISGFFSGLFRLNRDFVLESDPSLKLGGLGYQDLKNSYPEIAERFENFNLSVMSVFTDDEGKINELFVRLNKSKALSGAELRNAMSGPVPAYIRNIASAQFFADRVRFDLSRGADQNTAAKLLRLEFRGTIVDLKKNDLDRFVKEAELAEANVGEFEAAQTRCREVLSHMERVFLPKDPLLRTQGPVVVYYWLIRHLGIARLGRVREFLLRFEEARVQNRKLVQIDPRNSNVDAELRRFDDLNRSTNDAASIKGRFEILFSRFELWERDALARTVSFK